MLGVIVRRKYIPRNVLPEPRESQQVARDQVLPFKRSRSRIPEEDGAERKPLLGEAIVLKRRCCV